MTDPRTLLPCDTCDRHGPEFPGFESEMLNLHRAGHELGRTLLASLIDLFRIPQLFDWFERRYPKDPHAKP